MLERIRRDLTGGRSSMGVARVAGLAIGAIAVGTLVIAVIEQATEIPDASAVYLVAVVIVGSVAGTLPAVGTAIAAFLVYDLLFTEPRFSLVVADTNELLNLILVLIVAIAVGRLAALGRQREAEARDRAAEATGLFAVSRLLTTSVDTESVGPDIVERLAVDAALTRVWITLDATVRERVLADTGKGPVPGGAIAMTLVRTPGEQPARWVRAHDPSGRPPTRTARLEGELVRVRIEAGGTTYGSLWAVTPGATSPSASQTRLLSLAADQIALGLRRDALLREATAAEVARRSDALKSALLDSVSHDLRTPLASIRLTAGNLADPAIDWDAESVRRAAESIDDETRRLDRLVRSVLDLSRIESGALAPDVEVHDARTLIDRAVARARPTLGRRPLTIDVREDAPFIRVDAVLFDAILANLLDNVVDHTPDDAPVAIRVEPGAPGRACLTVEDGGPGVPAGDLERVFDKFTTSGLSGASAAASRRGMGVGLSIVRGMTKAMGGTATARRSSLGGLAIELDLPAAPDPPPEVDRP